MLTERPYVIKHGNISLAWAEAFLRIMAPPSQQLDTPLIVSIDEFDDLSQAREVPEIRDALDTAIKDINGNRPKPLIHRVDATAQTIFPHMCWKPQRNNKSADELFGWYLNRIYPKLKSRCRSNRRGTYFERMIEFKATDKDGNIKKVNQLRDIIGWFHDNAVPPINKAMQVVIRDPGKDHFPARSEFPCLQQVSFSRSANKLIVGAYYPTENIIERGYGNYLGLCRLGYFMAHECNLELARVNVFVSQPRMDLPKTIAPIQRLKTIVNSELERHTADASEES